ncbi:MAG: DUF2953 domain-containing protein [Bacillota bacterium]
MFETSAFWGLLRYRIAQPAIKPDVEGGASGIRFEVTTGEDPERHILFEGFNDLFRLFLYISRRLGRYKQPVLYLLRRAKITRFAWHTSLGTGDPGTTGIACGTLWMAIDILLGRFSPILKTSADVSVNPSFFVPLFGTSLQVNASVDLRHLFGAGVSFFLSLRR